MCKLCFINGAFGYFQYFKDGVGILFVVLKHIYCTLLFILILNIVHSFELTKLNVRISSK